MGSCHLPILCRCSSFLVRPKGSLSIFNYRECCWYLDFLDRLLGTIQDGEEVSMRTIHAGVGMPINASFKWYYRRTRHEVGGSSEQ